MIEPDSDRPKSCESASQDSRSLGFNLELTSGSSVVRLHEELYYFFEIALSRSKRSQCTATHTLSCVSELGLSAESSGIVIVCLPGDDVCIQSSQPREHASTQQSRRGSIPASIDVTSSSSLVVSVTQKRGLARWSDPESLFTGGASRAEPYAQGKWVPTCAPVGSTMLTSCIL